MAILKQHEASAVVLPQLSLAIAICFRRLPLRTIHNIEVVLGDLSAEGGVFRCPFYPRKNKTLGKFIFAKGTFALGG